MSGNSRCSRSSRLLARLVVCALFLGGELYAQESSADGLWQRVGEKSVSASARLPNDSIQSGRDYLLDRSRLRALLSNPSADGESVRMDLPLSNGTFATFALTPADAVSMSPAKDESGFICWEGVDPNDPTHHVVLTRAGDVVLAELARGNERTLILPVSENVHRVHKRDARHAKRAIECLARGTPAQEKEPVPLSWAGEQRTLRLAMACTGEYARARGGSLAQVMYAVRFTVQRLNQIYARDLGVRFVLVDGFDKVLFMDPDTDPFTNDKPYTLIEESQETIDRIIGDKNYDIGHTLSTGGGGLAAEGVGQTGLKARGVTGQQFPFADAFDVDYVAHEIAHQLGANHTFNGQKLNCTQANRNAGTAYEPGSGSTILSYAGICDADNIQANTDAYFHSASLDEMRTYLERHKNSLPPPARIQNSPPTLVLGSAFIVPKATPFRLKPVRFFDPDGDPLTFCWEQLDLGPAANLGLGDPTVVPLFRSIPPTGEPLRVLPRMQTVLRGLVDPAERLPTHGRKMRFRITVRDNRLDAAGVAMATQLVTVSDTAGPFVVTFPPEPLLRAGRVNVTWNVAATDMPPIDCRDVNILLSVDDGVTFPYTLISQTRNDGSELVDIPLFGDMTMRVMIESINGHFFAVSSSFRMMPSDASISFIPRAGDEPLLDRERIRTLLARGGIDAVIDVEEGRIRIYSAAADEGLPLDETQMLEFLRQPREESRTRNVLAIGKQEPLFALLRQLGGAPTDAVDMATLILSEDGSLYEGYSRASNSPGAFELIQVERGGTWIHDIDLNQQAITIRNLQEALQQRLPMD